MRSHEKITWQCKSTLTQPSEKKDEVQHETRETSTVRETHERKITVLSCFYTCFLMSSYLFSFVNLAPSLHACVCLFVFFFLARPRGTLIATAIIKETWKLRINLSLEVCFDSPQLSVSPTSKSFALQNTPADHEVFRPHETSESNHWNRNFLKSVSSRGQFNKTFTSVIYKCSYLFSDSKTMATLVKVSSNWPQISFRLRPQESR